MRAAWTRRTFLSAASTSPLLLASRGQETAGEAKKFIDPATEFEVLRILAPGRAAWLPYPENRAFSRKGDLLVLASDRDGTPQLYRHHFKQNKLKALTGAAKLNVDSFTLTAADKTLLYFDGAKLMAGSLNGGREREVFATPSELGPKLRLAASEDGAIVVIAGLRQAMWVSGKKVSEIVRTDHDLSCLAVRPRRMAISFIAGGRLRCIGLDGKNEIVLKMAAGEVLDAQWSADGTTLLYLVRNGGLPELRELNTEEGTDTFVARTSQFAQFQRNGDASVFLGTSASKASPYLVLLLRSPARELPVCEHRSSDARAVFSPNSARLAFQSDRDGKMAVFAMSVEKLVEETDSESQ
jgi:oligogalacturonide lyase